MEPATTLLLALVLVLTATYAAVAVRKFGLISAPTLLGASFSYFLILPAVDLWATGAIVFSGAKPPHDLAFEDQQHLFFTGLTCLSGAMAVALLVLALVPGLPISVHRSPRPWLLLRHARWPLGLGLLGCAVGAVLAGAALNQVGLAELFSTHWADRYTALFGDSVFAVVLGNLYPGFALGLWLLLLPELMSRSVWRIGLGVALLLSAMVALLLWNGTRMPSLEMILMTVFVLWRFGKARQRVTVVGLCAVALLAVLVAVFARSYTSNSDLDRVAVMTENQLDRGIDAVRMAGEFSDFHYFLEIIHEAEEPDPFRLDGQSFLRGFVFWLPRSVWPDKPPSFAVLAGERLEPGSFNTSLSTTIMGESYANFGLLGTWLVFGLQAGLCVVAAHRFDRGRHSSTPVLPIMNFWLAAQALQWCRNDFWMPLYESFVMGFVLWGLHHWWLLSRRSPLAVSNIPRANDPTPTQTAPVNANPDSR